MQTIYKPDFRILRNLVLLFLTALLLAACVTATPASLPAATQPPATPTRPLASPTPEPTNPSTRPFEPALATPASAEPAAGICMEAEGETAVVEIFPDIPPRAA